MISFFTVLLLMAGPGPEKQPADFVAYVEKIRAAGATESAEGDLSGTAGILVGQSTIEFPKDEDGNFGTRYSSTSCPPPGLSEAALARWSEEQDKKRQPVLNRLKRLADTDQSGFVSTEEGYRLRRDVEAGLRIVAVARTETLDMGRLREILSMDEQEFRSALEKYERIVQAVSQLPSVSLPSVPPELNARSKPGA